MEECDNCGCINEPEPDGWTTVFDGHDCYPEMTYRCPVCGSKMEEA